MVSDCALDLRFRNPVADSELFPKLPPGIRKKWKKRGAEELKKVLFERSVLRAVRNRAVVKKALFALMVLSES
jgi:hypothetical protein